MDKLIKIKETKKYDSYRFSSFHNDLQLIGLGKGHRVKNEDISSKELVNDTYKLGKEISNHINNYFQKKG